MSSSRPLALAAIFGILAFDPAAPSKTEPMPDQRTGRITAPRDDPRGLVFRLSEGRPGPAPADLARAATTVDPLPEAETRRLLDRLPPLEREAQARAFAFPAQSLPAPRPGRTESMAFPPAGTAPPPEAAASGPLSVLRRMPEGDVPLAPNLGVTFSQPMVALTSHEELARSAVPVTLSPQPPGEWRWVGTRTVTFEPDGRFPMATAYTVEVPAGTRSATGSVLAAAERWTFSTPPPSLVTTFPADEPSRHTPLMFAAFDQRIDPAAVLAAIRVRAGSVSPRLRLATLAEVNADPTVRALAERAVTGCWLAFTVNEPLPAASNVTVVVAAGTPSAEGPRRTAKPQQWSFRTYGPLEVVEYERTGMPYRGWSWSARFSNTLDAGSFNASLVTVEPKVDDLRASVHGSGIYVQGRFKPRARYTVVLGAAIADEFGQRLGTDVRLPLTIDAMDPLLEAPSPFLVLDPGGPRAYPLTTVGYRTVEMTLHAVGPGDWDAFKTVLRRFMDQREVSGVPGRRVLSRSIEIAGGPDDSIETPLDLSAALPAGRGHVIVVVQPGKKHPQTGAASRRYRGAEPSPIVAWVQATGLAVDVHVDPDSLTCWVTRLEDGAPVAGAEVEALPAGPRARTDAGGLARITLTGGALSAVVARSGGDEAFLPGNPWPWGDSGWTRQLRTDQLRWFVFDDRRMYRPGERARFKGWVRRWGAGPGGDIGRPDGVTAVDYIVRDPRNNELTRGSAPLNRWGGFDLTAEIPKSANLGPATLELGAAGESAGARDSRHFHRFQIQAFRTPEFEVTATSDGGPHLVGGDADVTVSASYYAGGALPDAEVNWRATSQPASYTPPGRRDFVFGGGPARWDVGNEGRPAEQPQTLGGRTDAGGRHHLRIDFDAVSPARVMSLNAEATVTDVNRQAWTARANLLVHAADTYVGVKLHRGFVGKGEPLALDLIATGLDGAAVAGRAIDARAERITWEQEQGQWRQRLAGRQDCRVTSGTESVACRFTPSDGGLYRVTAVVHDESGRPNETVVEAWVAGERMIGARRLEADQVTLVPSQKEYRAGEVAEVLVVAPFTPAEGVMTLSRSGTLRTERFTMKEASTTLRFDVEEAWTPNVNLQVDLAGRKPREDGKGTQPAFAIGREDLSVSIAARTLGVTATPREVAIEPGGSTTVDLVVRDQTGTGVAGAEVALVVVDEAILALSGGSLPAPLAGFYGHRPADVQTFHQRRFVRLAAAIEESVTVTGAAPGPEGAMRVGGAPGGVVGGVVDAPMAAPMMAQKAEAGTEAPGAAIMARSDFDPLAVFAASVETGAGGTAVSHREAARQPHPLPRDGGGGRRGPTGSASANRRSRRGCR